MNWLTAKVAQGIALALLILCMGLGLFDTAARRFF